MTAGVFAPAQQSQQPTPKPGQIDSTRPEKANDDTEAVYGRIKDVKAGERIVVQVNNAPDKTYNLNDAKKTVRLAEGLAVGDRVKVLESEVKGNHSVQIERDTRKGETRSRAEEPREKKR
jgi:hypothetical protein